MAIIPVPRPDRPISKLGQAGSALVDGDWYRFFAALGSIFGPTGLLLPNGGGTGIDNSNTNTISLNGPIVTGGSINTGGVVTTGGDLTTTAAFHVTTHDGTISFPVGGTTQTMPSASKTLMANDFSNASSAGGDLSGTYPSPTVAKINGHALGDTTPTAGFVLQGDGSQWKSQNFAHGATGEATGSALGSTSTTGTMLGLKGSFTPTVTGKVLFVISGSAHHSSAGGSFNYQIRHGTGTAPNNGAPLAGSADGIKAGGQSSTAGNKEPFSIQVIVSGLTLSTAYWFDLSLDNGGSGTATVDNVIGDAIEL